MCGSNDKPSSNRRRMARYTLGASDMYDESLAREVDPPMLPQVAGSATKAVCPNNHMMTWLIGNPFGSIGEDEPECSLCNS